MGCQPSQPPHDIDLDALRGRYREERDRRLRTDGSTQYRTASGELASFFEHDPHTPPAERAPVSAEDDVVVIGGGFAGLIAAARLRQAGVERVRVLDMGGDFGGTWYWNRYPGIQCDNDAYCYIPLLEELGVLPTQKYANGREIFDHCRRIGSHFGLYETALFGTRVRSLRWDEDEARWRIETNRGDDLRPRFVVMALGFANRPKLPGVPGIERFKGKSFHTARWDYDYTSGDAQGDLSGLKDQRVAVIGTGASAIQVVPHLGRDAQQLYVFQRTPSSVDARGNAPTDPDWAASLQPGWQRERQANFHAWSPLGFLGIVPGLEDQVCDFWTEMTRNVADQLAGEDPASVTPERLGALLEREDYRVMERLRRRVDDIVEDPATAERLKPWFRFLCKRPLSNDDYLPTFNRPNVQLVDVSDAKGIERISERGVVAGGVEYEVDCIVYATGFEISTELSRRYGIDVIEGRDGRSLYDHWSQGFVTLHGLTTHGFPNQFFMGFSQGAVSANTTSMYEQQAEHLSYIIKTALDRGVSRVEPTQAAQDAWCRTIRESALPDDGYAEACTPGYYNNEGGGGGEGIRSHLGEPYGPGFYAFDELLKAWRDAATLDGLELSN